MYKMTKDGAYAEDGVIIKEESTLVGLLEPHSVMQLNTS